MSKELQELIEKARRAEMTPEQKEEQRISFAYGNTRFDNESMTRETVMRASESLKEQPHEQGERPRQQ